MSTNIMLQSRPTNGRESEVAAPAKLDCTLHLGMPKTATTTLQRFLFPHHSQIHALGKFSKQFPAKRYLTNSLESFANECLPQPDRRENAPTVQAVQSVVRELRGKGKVLTFSREGSTSGGEKKKRAAARLFHEAFGDCQVLVTIREPFSFIEALYFQHLKGFNLNTEHHKEAQAVFGTFPRYFGINEWLDMHWQRPTMGAIESLKVADTLEIYAEEFGKENVGALLFEQLKDAPTQFAKDLSAFLGVDADETQRLIHQRVANDRWDEERLAQLQRIVRSPWSRWRFRRDRAFRDHFSKGPANGFTGPKPRAQLSEIWQERILNIALGQARRLQRDWGLPLAQYGYPVD